MARRLLGPHDTLSCVLIFTSKARDNFTSRGLGFVLVESNFPSWKQSLIDCSVMSLFASFKMWTQQSISDLVRILFDTINHDIEFAIYGIVRHSYMFVVW